MPMAVNCSAETTSSEIPLVNPRSELQPYIWYLDGCGMSQSTLRKTAVIIVAHRIRNCLCIEKMPKFVSVEPILPGGGTQRYARYGDTPVIASPTTTCKANMIELIWVLPLSSKACLT
mmetsp:Transcript_2780/g.4163  ORF Transcript_2780/g.4163 Transcript_2780/m.4163 type:complete len:118 (+) Transcript_2780:845-1198(+)